ncbi:MAG: hypothetical protein CM15mP105_0650 [Methanobacteriota archaeon]|nr:MAG: hypothetical protein CM15mP105_0650 [Euryarchaeota archaeon]
MRGGRLRGCIFPPDVDEMEVGRKMRILEEQGSRMLLGERDVVRIREGGLPWGESPRIIGHRGSGSSHSV